MGAAIGWPLAALAAWLGLNVLAVAAGVRIVRLRRRGAGAIEADEPVRFEPVRERPTGDGYASLLLTRLVVHARRVLGVDQAILLVRGHRRPNRLIVVAAHGAEKDLVGQAVPVRGVLQRLVSDRPLRHGPLEEIVPDGGSATAMTAAAPVPSGELVLLCAASTDCGRGFTRHELELLGELSATCATAISDVALGARLEPMMRVLAGGLSGPETEAIHRPFDAPSVAAQAGTALGLDQPALAELDMA
ncbi:MAG: GAF domain-containing protein, partial [Solirubrobacterales bacterium]